MVGGLTSENQGTDFTEYLLHFIGSGLYTKEAFIAESEKLGVNRAFPTLVIRKLSWGSKILLAQYVPGNLTKELELYKTTDKLQEFNKAIVFGFYTIEGINLSASEEFKSELVSQLDVHEVSNGGGVSVARRCGSYSIIVTYSVTNSIAEIVEKALALSEKRNEKIKIFVAGRFHPLADKVLSPITFSRAGLLVKLNEKLDTAENEGKQLSFLGDYSQRKYLKKKERGTLPLDHYMEGDAKNL